MSRSTLVALVALVATASLGIGFGCGAGIYGYQDTLSDWRSRHYSQALTRATAMYDRFRDDNDLAKEQVALAVASAREQLETTPVVPSATPTPPPLDTSPEGPPTAMGRAIQADLLSNQITPIFRAAGSVGALGLSEYAPLLITVIFSREPVAADGGVLPEAGVALRSVAAKRVALDALGRLVPASH